MKKSVTILIIMMLMTSVISAQVSRNEKSISGNKQKSTGIGNHTISQPTTMRDAKAALDAELNTINIPLGAYCGPQNITPTVVIRNAGTTTLTSCVVKYRIDAGTIVTQNWSGNLAFNATANVTFLPVAITNGSHTFTAWTSSPNSGTDQVTSNDTLVKPFVVSAGAPLPFVQNFESTTFAPVNWSIDNPDGSYTWERHTATGNGSSTAAAFINFYSYNDQGQTDELITEPIDLTSVSDAIMTFNVAYRQYQTETDQLQIFISTNCGATYNTTPVYDKSGATLATTTPSTNAFTPSTAAQWRNDTVNLDAYVGNSVVLKFVAINDYGNNLYIDDINIYSLSAPPVASFSADPLTTCTGIVDFTDLSGGNPASWLWNFGDGTTSTEQSPTHAYLTSGTFSVTLTVTNANGTDQLTQTNLITISLPAAPTATAGSRCGPGTVGLSATGAGTLEWYDIAIGGTLLGTGTTFTTPVISATTTYYVQNNFASPSEYVGKTDNTGTGGYYTQSTIQGIIFDAFVPFKLVSVKVYNQTAGNKTITLQNSGGTVLQTKTVNVPSGESRVTLDFDVPVGTNLKLLGPSYPSLYRNSGSVTYPYTLAGVLSMTTSTASTTPLNYYYYFYDWEVQEPGCISARVPVIATIKPYADGGVAYGDPNTVCSGGTTTLRDSLYVGNTFQWQTSPNGVSGWANIPGATGITYNTSPITSTYYARLIVTNTCNADTSNVLTVTLSTGAVAGTASASPTTVCYGNTTTFTLTGYSGNIQWQRSFDHITWQNISSGINPTFTTPGLTMNVWGRAVVTIPNCGSQISNDVLITVVPGPDGGTASAANTSICTGTSTTLALDSSYGNIQWQSSNDGTTWNNIGGATSATYNTPTLTANRYYRAILTVSGCGTDTSNVVLITVNTAPVGGTATVSPSSTICSGTSATITLTGYNGTIQWQGTPTGTGWTNINGATSDTYITPILTSDYYYRAVVLSAGCGSVFSTSVHVTVTPSPDAGTADATLLAVCTGSGTSLSLSGYTGNIQWQSSPDGSSWSNISGATSDTYNTPNLSATTYYMAVVSTAGCSPEYSNALQISVSSSAVGGFANAASNNICSGTSTDITLIGYSGNIQWQESPDGSTWTDITGATSPILNTGPVTSDTYFQAAVTLPGCGSSVSTFAYITVTPAAVGGTASSSLTTVCENDPITLTLTGYTGSIQWQYSPDNANWMDLAGATTASFTSPIPVSLYLSAVVSLGSCPDAVSTVVYVTVNPDPDASFSYSPNQLTVTFTNTSTNATSYLWAFGDGGISTQASPVYNYATDGIYNVTMIAINSCGSDTTTLTINVVSTGIANNDATPSVTVFPNPSTGIVSVKGVNTTIDRVVITDVIGRTVLTKELSDNFATFDLSNNYSGVYFIEVKTGSTRHVYKLLITR